MSTEPDAAPAPAPGDDRRAEAEAIYDQFVRFVRTIKRMSSRSSAQQHDGIEQAAYVLLFALASEGPQRTTALAETVRCDTSTVSRQVGALVRHGLVERQADPADGRACLLAATQHGRDRLELYRQARVAEVARLLAHWSPADLHAAIDLLDRLNTDFERDEPPHHSTDTRTTALKAGHQ